MRHHGNPGLSNRPNTWRDSLAAFDFHHVGTRTVDHPHSISDGVLIRLLVGAERQIRDDECVGSTSHHSASQRDEFLHRDRRRR